MEDLKNSLGAFMGIAKAFRQMQTHREQDLMQANPNANYATGILRGQAQTWELAAQWIEREIILQAEINGVNRDEIQSINVKPIPF